MIYHVLVSLEEGMEMMGVIGFIHALLAYIATHYGEVRFAFAGAHATATATEPANESALQPQTGQ
jgi:hypothetical protein